MRPVNETLRQAKLAVAIEQFNTIQARLVKAQEAVLALASQLDKKSAQIIDLGGTVETASTETVKAE